MYGMLQQHVAATCSDKTCAVQTEAIRSRDEQREHIAGTKLQHLHTHENVAGTCPRDVLQRHVPSCKLTNRMVHSLSNFQLHR